jgi:hypothetical protein
MIGMIRGKNTGTYFKRRFGKIRDECKQFSVYALEEEVPTYGRNTGLPEFENFKRTLV